ncbi:MAG: GNAT family N-acetyltransferase [Burkholderiales bacterium]|nr:GNAT family N-acetyltransferase [Burkholderiales bacterium]
MDTSTHPTAIADWVSTPRLILRAWHEADLDAFASLTADPQVMRYVGDGTLLDRVRTAEWIMVANRNREKWGYGTHAVVERASGRVIGWAGLIHSDNAQDTAAEIIYALSPASWGRGYATELARGIIDWAWQHSALQRIVATIMPDNASSIAMMGKLGFASQGVVVEDDGVRVAHFHCPRPDSAQRV